MYTVIKILCPVSNCMSVVCDDYIDSVSMVILIDVHFEVVEWNFFSMDTLLRLIEKVRERHVTLHECS